MDQNNQQMATPEEKQKLLDMIEKIQGGLSTLNAKSVAGKHQEDLVKSELLQKIFNNLRMAGVNLEDRESVRAFIDKLKQQSPMLAAQFEVAMSVLMGEQDPLTVNMPGDPSVGQGKIDEALLKG
jgi:hypothetical protein